LLNFIGQLNEECNYDPQCPANSYCSISKFGCLCHNGYGPALVSNAGLESLECLPKLCTNSSSCESEFHECEENKCKCIATHFDPTNSKCYKFGSTGGKPTDGSEGKVGNLTNAADDVDNFSFIFKDLRGNRDKMWLVLIILISLMIFLSVVIFMLLRKHYLGYCWQAHKKEYEPNNKSPPRNGYFNKNSINNKSFRQKSSEIEEGEEEEGEDDTNLVIPSTESEGYAAFAREAGDDQSQLVKLNIKENNHSSGSGNSYHFHGASPLKSSTSTPV